jgi:biotin transport system permease protein
LVVLRLAAMMLLADLVAATTTVTAMMEAIVPVLAPLRYVGLRPKRLALGVALVLRFVPVMLDGWRARNEAWRARSGRRVPLRLVASFLADAMRLADQAGEALDARGFDAGPRRPAGE